MRRSLWIVTAYLIGVGAGSALGECPDQDAVLVDPPPYEDPVQVCGQPPFTWTCDTLIHDPLPQRQCTGVADGYECVQAGWAQEWLTVVYCGSYSTSCPQNPPMLNPTNNPDYVAEKCPE